MVKNPRWKRQLTLSVRVERLARELEALVPELKDSLEAENPYLTVLSSAAKTLERATAAIRALIERAKPGRPLGGDLRSMLEGTSPLMSLLGSRLILAGSSKAAARPPSAGAQALAALLEDPEREFQAEEIARRLGCSVPSARTTLNRLVRSGHAARPVPGRFRAIRH